MALQDGLVDTAELLMQVAIEEPEILTNLMVQTAAIANNFIQEMPPVERTRFAEALAQTRSLGYDWLANVNAEVRTRVGEMLTQTGYGQIMLATMPEDVADAALSFFAQYGIGIP